MTTLGLFVVKLPDFVRTTTFRWTSTAFAACILLFSAFVYWEAWAYTLVRMDASIVEESLAIAADSPDRQLNAIDDRLSEDPRRIKLAGLFAADGRRISGNLASLPHDLKIDGVVQGVAAIRIDQKSPEKMTVRAVARKLPSGNVLVVGRNIDDLKPLAEVIAQALLMGLPVALGLGLMIGMVLSVRA